MPAGRSTKLEDYNEANKKLANSNIDGIPQGSF